MTNEHRLKLMSEKLGMLTNEKKSRFPSSVRTISPRHAEVSIFAFAVNGCIFLKTRDCQKHFNLKLSIDRGLFRIKTVLVNLVKYDV